jgi:hypothetical protein
MLLCTSWQLAPICSGPRRASRSMRFAVGRTLRIETLRPDCLQQPPRLQLRESHHGRWKCH